jgi:hypothetical protein
MWKKRLDYYMGDVYFTNELNGQIRELRFAFNTCIDSIYTSVQDLNEGKKKSQNVICLAEDFTKYISAQNDIEQANKLEALLVNADYYFQIPDEFLGK